MRSLHIRHLGFGLLLLSASASGISCNCSNSSHNLSPAELEKQLNYKRGPWWRDAAQLNDLVLGGAQIVLTHANADREELKTRFLTAHPERSREEALRLAVRLRGQLRDSPEHFSKLAKQYSDDPRTSAAGGSLGTFHASDVPESVIDAFGNIKKGDISSVVETPAGFYVVSRRAVPAEQRVAARHIVVMYAGSQGWARLDRPVSRSRDEARSRANRIASEVRRNPQAFAVFVHKDSDAYDATSGGDFGVWSTYERGDPGLLGVIASLKVGETSNAIEGVDGFHIFQRTDVTDRPVLASSQLVISYAGAFQEAYRAPAKRSKEEARTLANEYLHTLQLHPERFEELRSKVCDVPWFCGNPAATAKGRDLSGVDSRVSEVPVGTIVNDVLETPVGFHLVRREDPQKFVVPEPKLTFEFAHPPPHSLNWTLANASAEQLSSETRKLARDASPALQLKGDEAKYFVQILDRFADRVKEVPASERLELAQGVQRELLGLLGPARGQAFERFRDDWIHARQGP